MGRELARLSYLGPFLGAASLFAEDDPLVAERMAAAGSSPDSLRPVVAGLQQEVELTRHLLHKVFYALLANGSSREATLQWIGAALRRNEKRSMINVESRLVAGDGFFLNLAAVMHQLSLKIKLDKVRVVYFQLTEICGKSTSLLSERSIWISSKGPMLNGLDKHAVLELQSAILVHSNTCIHKPMNKYSIK